MPASAPSERLAPAPDFRYVGLNVAEPTSFGLWAGLAAAGAVAGGTVLQSPAGALLGVGAVASAGVVSRAWRGSVEDETGNGSSVGLAIVPWGVMVETRDRSRIVRWPGIVRVQVETVHGRDQGTPTTRYSLVTIDTVDERFIGRGAGALPLERLSAHLEAYAREASHRVALDLDGAHPGEGPSEPDAELLLAAARAFVETGAAAGRLHFERGSYRETRTRGTDVRAIRVLADVLRDRTAREVDPRPFAAIVAVELNAVDVADDLVELVQSPHPLLAAVAKVAASKLGASPAKVGSLEEVEPFLLRGDAEALAAWQAA